ncbi:mannose-6-phosphate isomerase, class I [Shewanella sp. GXUN23E]|uniref:mannose-6-phosphate isomerase, class I n=1 Tax=Shewanella sp. GXUN23E TaxID=3422498 RepID=UPI003D7CD29D
MIFQLTNPIKNFQWGCPDAFFNLFNIANPDRLPQAELWMGAHPSSSSRLTLDNRDHALVDVINAKPELWLGKKCEQFESQLPFLVKLLAAHQPLSIQVHPSKEAAKIGFDKENAQGISLNAPERNYKDANHKPELLYAITPYLAMNGFRKLDEIHRFFSRLALPSLCEIIEPFLSRPCTETLAQLFESILLLDESLKSQAINELLNCYARLETYPDQVEILKLISEFSFLYPDDVGLFSPLFLNVIELQPGEVMYLAAETPHAYIKGVGVEVMANSDNVLRAGLTPKYIDVQELLANTKFESLKMCDLKLKPVETNGRLIYPTPVDDFKFDIIKAGTIDISVSSPEIILCINGTATINSVHSQVTLAAGQSVIIPAVAPSYSLTCTGTVARTYC